MKHKLFLGVAAAAALLMMPSPQASAQSGPSDPDAIDYSVLYNSVYNYAELKQAKSRDLSDTQIAKIAIIAEDSGESFNDIVNAVVVRGQTFTTLASKYGIPLSDLDNVQKEKDQIANYISAYETSGKYGVNATAGGGAMSGGMAMSPMPSGSMPAGGMAPAAPTPTGMSSNTSPMPVATGDVVDVAMANPQLSTLVKAIQAAGLVDTLKGTGPFTIFAPNNRAFARLGRVRGAALMADPAMLKNVLTYHVIAGAKVDAATAMAMTSPTSPPTVQGGTLQVVTKNGKVMINNATVVQADIMASNGIIHIIDRVLMPPAATP